MELSCHSLERITLSADSSTNQRCRCGRRFTATKEEKSRRHFGSNLKKTVTGWLKLNFNQTSSSRGSGKDTPLSVSTASLSIRPCTNCQNHCLQCKYSDGRGDDRGQFKKASWSKWKKRLASSSLHRREYRGERSNPQTGPAKRALPPVPSSENHNLDEETSDLSADETVEDSVIAYMPPMSDLATSIEKVKSYGWYWGPISREVSEHLLANEPDGSFIVRDSSADHYIFSLTFKLNQNVRHVRIENDQGFSFGSLTTFKSNTIVDFIENAVEHSRSGRYLFFLHHRPERGPMRVQLLNPVSRFKKVQSLQHLCRFVILKLVPRVLLPKLPVPNRVRAYLDTPFYFAEVIADSTLPGNVPMSMLLTGKRHGALVGETNYA